MYDSVRRENRGVRSIQMRCVAGQQPVDLAPIEQALVLAHAAIEQRTKAHAPGTLHWHLAPYVETLLAQESSRASIQAAAVLLRARHEVERTRVRERGILAYETLGQHLKA
jgi:hypothetical protein